MACIYARHRRHNADEYIYVVDRQQANHFTHLKQLLCLRGDQDLAERIHHHSYGNKNY
jgi:arginyl-tRNA synthetase